MKILIDADGCPVVDLTISAAKKHKIDVLILCDTSHNIKKTGARTLVFSKGSDSVDFELVNLVNKGDVVVTQDYGLAAMCLARSAIVINQNGMLYDNDNIDSLLFARHTAKKIRNAGGRLKGPSRRTQEEDTAFKNKLDGLLDLNK